MHRSQLNLFRDIGVLLFGPHSREALQFAMNRIALPEPGRSDRAESSIDSKPGRGYRTKGKKAVPPSFFGSTFFGRCQKGVLVVASFGDSFLGTANLGKYSGDLRGSLRVSGRALIVRYAFKCDLPLPLPFRIALSRIGELRVRGHVFNLVVIPLRSPPETF